MGSSRIRLRAVALLAACAVVFSGCGVQILYHGAAKSDDPVAQPEPWLDATTFEKAGGYIAITAEVILSEKTYCFAPISNTKFSEQQSEIVILVTPRSFDLLGPGEPADIPIYENYQRSVTGRSCEEPIGRPILIVASHPLRKNVRYRLDTRLVYSGVQEERVSEWATLLAGAVRPFLSVTPAATLAGLTAALQSDAATVMAKIYRKLNSAKVAGKQTTIAFTFDDIAKGQRVFRVPLFRAKTSKDDLNQAIAEALRDKTGELIGDVVFTVYPRRSLFASTLGADALPQTQDLNRNAILQFPNTGEGGGKRPLPNMLQQLTSRAPTLITRLGSGTDYIVACKEARGTLDGLGLSRLDQALAFDAIMTEARPNWRSETSVIGDCFAEEWIHLLLNEVYGKGGIYISRAPDRKYPEFAQELDDPARLSWKRRMYLMLEKIREAFNSRSTPTEASATRWKELLKDATEVSVEPGLGWNAAELAQVSRRAGELARVPMLSGGCFLPTTPVNADVGTLVLSLDPAQDAKVARAAQTRKDQEANQSTIAARAADAESTRALVEMAQAEQAAEAADVRERRTREEAAAATEAVRKGREAHAAKDSERADAMAAAQAARAEAEKLAAALETAMKASAEARADASASAEAKAKVGDLEKAEAAATARAREAAERVTGAEEKAKVAAATAAETAKTLEEAQATEATSRAAAVTAARAAAQAATAKGEKRTRADKAMVAARAAEQTRATRAEELKQALEVVRTAEANQNITRLAFVEATIDGEKVTRLKIRHNVPEEYAQLIGRSTFDSSSICAKSLKSEVLKSLEK